MAHKKAGGKAENLRDSNPKYRGVKLFAGQTARAGNIIVRQKGDKYGLGHNVYKGKDFTIHAKVDGVVFFKKKKCLRFDGRKYLTTMVEIIPAASADQVVQPTPVKKEKKAVVKAAPKKAEKEVTAKAVVEKKEKKVAAVKKPAVKKPAAPKKKAE